MQNKLAKVLSLLSFLLYIIFVIDVYPISFRDTIHYNAFTLQKKGYELHLNEDYSLAIEYLNESTLSFKKIGDLQRCLLNDIYIANCFKGLHDYKKCFFVLDSLKIKYPDSIYEKNKPLIYYQKQILYSHLRDFKNAMLYFDSIEIKMQSGTNITPYIYKNSLTTMAFCLKETCRFDEAIIYYKKSMLYSSFSNYDSIDKSKDYLNLAILYYNMKDYYNAFLQLDKSKRLCISFSSINSKLLSDIYMMAGILKNRMHDPIEALYYFNLAGQQRLRDPHTQMKQRSRIIHNKAVSYDLLGELDSSLKLLIESSFIAKKLGMSDINYDYRALAEVYSKLGDYKASDHYFQKTLASYKDTSFLNTHRLETSLDYARFLVMDFDEERGIKLLSDLDPGKHAGYPSIFKLKYYTILGEYAIEKDNYRLASESYKKAAEIQQKELTYKHGYVYATPEITGLYTQLAILNSEIIINGQFMDEPQSYVENFRHYSNLTMDLIFQLEMSCNDFEGKVLLVSFYQPMIDRLIKYWIGLSDKVDKDVFKEQLAQLLLYKKFIISGGMAMEHAARRVTGIPDTLLKLESYLKSSLTRFYKEIYYSDPISKDPDFELNQQIAYYAMRYDSLVSEIEKNFPEYYSRKYEFQGLTIADIRTKLSNREMIFDYTFISDSILVIQELTKDGHEIFILHLDDDYFRHVNNVNDFLSDKYVKNCPEGVFNSFQDASHELYKLLLGNYFSVDKSKSLVVIPDGILSNIPFEVLITDNNKASAFATPNYLLKSTPVLYAYSIPSYLAEANAALSSPGQLVSVYSFSQEFTLEDKVNVSGDGYDPGTLPYSQVEATNISNLLQGSLYNLSDLEEMDVKRLFEGHQILHLVTHNTANETNPLLSGIQPDLKSSSGAIHAIDIMNMDLKSELVILSGCNTGTGTDLKGEGLFSIAKAFYIAGCPNAIISLNKTEDFAAEKIISSCIGYLESGYSMTESMRRAKMDYISSSSTSHSHPFYWSSIIFVGNKEKNAPKPYLFYYAAVSAIIILSVIWYMRRRRKFTSR